MTVSVSKPSLNLREELSALKKPSGIKGEEILRANTAADVYGVIGQNRNMVINGAMSIAQRATSVALISGQSNYYTVDRFGHQNGGYNGTVTYSQVADAPPGFEYSAKMTMGSPAHTGSLSATSYAGWYNMIEGYDCQRLAWGTSSAKPVTISFWVKSSVTGSYPHVGIRCDTTSGTYSNFFNFNINSANTWEYKTVTIPGCPATLSNKTNGLGIQLHINVLAGVGGGGTPTPGVWANNNFLGTNAQFNNPAWVGTVGATFQITGVQLEVGTVATPFEYRPYASELELCMRYYQRQKDGVIYSQVGMAMIAALTGSGTAKVSYIYPIPMRAAPTISVIGTNSFVLQSGNLSGTGTFEGAWSSATDENGTWLDFNAASNPGWATRDAVAVYRNGSGSGTLQFSAEL